MIKAKIITHSNAPSGDELITIQTKAPKFLDAEIEKHRMISSNSSSDRAIPFNKMLEKDIFIPQDVRLNEKGMQGYTEASIRDIERFRCDVGSMYDYTRRCLESERHIHKQHLNRYLLPFSYQDKVMTANIEQWDYFINLRASEYADPAIQQLAIAIDGAIQQSEPAYLQPGQWHLPYVSDIVDLDTAVNCSVARCARVSYSNHDGSNPDIEADIKLANKLSRMRHMTPFEHQATPMSSASDYGRTYWEKGVSHVDRNNTLWSGNFKGFIQNRKLLEEQ